ncbi:hypothetical protein ACERII_03710 [Evansella sp. AB-rgal1]|uniref:hypothetical protein n=1 Tax=Evansella sp. AB-rgal1 TaxID=3242696 RepID=UPI00359E25A9
MKKKKKGLQKSLMASWTTYNIGRTTFSNFIWVNNGIYFYNPGVMSVELMNRVDAFAIEVYELGGVYAGKAVWRNRAGWVALDWRDTTLVTHPGGYGFRFVNEGNTSVVNILHGALEYGYRNVIIRE